MIPKLKNYMNVSRLPLFLRKKNNQIYFQLQIEVARDDNYCAGCYCEFEKTISDESLQNIGNFTLQFLSRFQQIGDLSLSEFYSLTRKKINEYEDSFKDNLITFLDIKTEKEIDEKFIECSVEYIIAENIYKFSLSWIYKEGNKKYRDSSDSTGKTGILTFEEPLEFDDSISPEELGKMVLEAFDRSEKMAEKMSGTYCPPKTIDLYNGSFLEVTPPLDKHFADYEDYGVGEIYQVYSYLKKEGDKPSANFMITIAPEIRDDLSADNIKKAWAEVYGASEDISAEEKNNGIFGYRAEIQNSDIFRISYFKELDDESIIECCMEVKEPLKKQKLIEKLIPMFEKFALKCRIK